MGSPASDCVRHLHRSKIQSGQLVDKTAMNIGSVLADPVTWIILTGTALYLLYRRGTTNFTVFSDQGIPGPKPVPFLGNAWGMWKQNFQTSGREQVKKYGKVFGSFLSIAPSLNTIDTNSSNRCLSRISIISSTEGIWIFQVSRCFVTF